MQFTSCCYCLSYRFLVFLRGISKPTKDYESQNTFSKSTVEHVEHFRAHFERYKFPWKVLYMWSRITPRYWYSVTDWISCLVIVCWDDCCPLKSLLRWEQGLTSQHLMKWSGSGPCCSFPSCRRFTEVVVVFVQELVYQINNTREKTQSWGEPVEVVSLSESKVPTLV